MSYHPQEERYPFACLSSDGKGGGGIAKKERAHSGINAKKRKKAFLLRQKGAF